MAGRAEQWGLNEVRGGTAGRQATSARSRLYQILAVSLVLHGALLWQLPFQADPEPIPEPLQRLAVTLVKTPVAPLEPTPVSPPVLLPVLPVEAPLASEALPPKQSFVPEEQPLVSEKQPVVPDMARELPPPVRAKPKAVAPAKAVAQTQVRQQPRTEMAPTAPIAELDSQEHRDRPDLKKVEPAAIPPLDAPARLNASFTQIDPALARMQPLEDSELARVKINDRRSSQEIRRWDWLNEYLVRIERQVYATWAQAGRWPGRLNGVIRFQLDEQGRLQDAFLQLASGDPALDRSLLTALSRTMKPGLEESRQLAAMNYRHFRFHFNGAGEARRGQELVPWEQETAGEDHRSR